MPERGATKAGLRRQVAVLVGTRDEGSERTVNANPRPEARVRHTRADRYLADADHGRLVLIECEGPHVQVADPDMPRMVAPIVQGTSLVARRNGERTRYLGEPEDVVADSVVGSVGGSRRRRCKYR